MTTPSPDPPELRISDADRERAVQRLNDAVAEGRLSMDEFEERVAAVLRARTAKDVAPHLADLPGGSALVNVAGHAGEVAARENGELRTTMSTLTRSGRWTVPRRLQVVSKAGTVRLDLTSAVLSHPVIEVALEVYMGTTHLVLPPRASVDVEQVETGMVASSVKVRGVTRSSQPAGEPHVVVTGKQWAGTLVVRHQRRFLWWRW